ncbi:glutamate 5-kinase [Dethiosulfatibacter aminovorans DSM 17477]|uniref:Glutamate 5-kinase n=1 Tax=Dethiosulfatibacter aminovorans DSM 17477 TaxID=1121476 RepID=A0A1M6F307_9FIRM|nr:glutamate 5-kinase [Dethiosulfatibacter aminovorans]SHI92055.1 glutamate 5-kinase [Dethiosulfatibacter aminovorans DSM 17477]
MRTELRNAKRIVVKIGTTSLTYSNGTINFKKLENLARVLTDLRNSGREIVLVSSGAVGAGMSRLGLKEKPVELKEKQATAAVGQALMMQFYQKFFNEYNQTIAQLLLTKDVITDKIKRRNVENTLSTLLEMGVIPIANENDSVATDELEGSKIGDNDTLSSMTAILVKADALLMLSDIDGLYDSSPVDNPDAKLISFVDKIDKELYSIAGDSSSIVGTGGMYTKIRAAEHLMKEGIHTVIASGEDVKIIYDILAGNEIGTFFSTKGKDE